MKKRRKSKKVEEKFSYTAFLAEHGKKGISQGIVAGISALVLFGIKKTVPVATTAGMGELDMLDAFKMPNFMQYVMPKTFIADSNVLPITKIAKIPPLKKPVWSSTPTEYYDMSPMFADTDMLPLQDVFAPPSYASRFVQPTAVKVSAIPGYGTSIMRPVFYPQDYAIMYPEGEEAMYDGMYGLGEGMNATTPLETAQGAVNLATKTAGDIASIIKGKKLVSEPKIQISQSTTDWSKVLLYGGIALGGVLLIRYLTKK